MRNTVLIFLLSRVLSAIGSLVLFAWFARSYDNTELAKIFSILFIFGFAVATLRMTIQYTANISEHSGPLRKIRSASGAIHFNRYLLVVVATIIAVYFFSKTNDLLSSICFGAVLIVASSDIDIVRAAGSKPMSFPIMFAAGTAFALLLFKLFEPSFMLGVWCILCQWLPTAIANLKYAIFSLRRCRGNSGGPAVGLATFAVAGFEGLILNFPFFSFLGLGAQVLASYGIIMRLLVSSFLFGPVAMYWSNAPKSPLIQSKIAVPRALTFFVTLALSTWLLSILLFGFYRYGLGVEVTNLQLALVIILATSVVLFRTAARFVRMQYLAKGSFLTYLLGILVFGLMLIVLVEIALKALVAFQVFALGSGAVLYWRLSCDPAASK